jgi:hypothetical protein
LAVSFEYAVLLLFAAGGLMLANFNEPPDFGGLEYSEVPFMEYLGSPHYYSMMGWGWPMKAAAVIQLRKGGLQYAWYTKAIFVDVIVCIGILLSVYVLCEWLICRREGRSREGGHAA